MEKGLYVNHRKEQCGVYEFGKEIGTLLATSNEFDIEYCECDSLDELKQFFEEFRPDFIIYNYHPSTMGWARPTGLTGLPVGFHIPAIHIGTIHEVNQKIADKADNNMFDFHIGPDPTLLLKNPIVYKTGRLLPQKVIYVENNSRVPIIGSFGFATYGKGFDKIITLVQKEFGEAVIKLNIPFATFGDSDGSKAKALADECRKLVINKSISLEINHDYLEKKDLINFLSSNSINVFLYDDQKNRGISSVIDWALAAGRPVAISRSRLFRHLFKCRPSICVEDNSLKTILKNDVLPLQHLWEEFDPKIILWEYETIIHDIINKTKLNTNTRNKSGYYYNSLLRKTRLNRLKKMMRNVWTTSNDQSTIAESPNSNLSYTPVKLQTSSTLNRILDNKARSEYEPAIQFLEKNFPSLIANKIAEANIQQAFVLDTAVRLSEKFSNPKVLAVGAFEDTAVAGLRSLNVDMVEIDPVLNYDLATYLTKPGVTSGLFDIIISTSVIEHVKEDEQFVKDIAFLLAKSGYAIITCDYKDQYKPGDDIPDVDFRFYTQKDLKERLLKAIPDCKLVDAPEWECENPDFYYLKKYNYTFATLVFQKN